MLPFNVCTARYDLPVSQLPTYWDEYGELFIYWQAGGPSSSGCHMDQNLQKSEEAVNLVSSSSSPVLHQPKPGS